MEELLLDLGMRPVDACSFATAFGSIALFLKSMDGLLVGEKPSIVVDVHARSWKLLAKAYGHVFFRFTTALECDEIDDEVELFYKHVGLTIAEAQWLLLKENIKCKHDLRNSRLEFGIINQSTGSIRISENGVGRFVQFKLRACLDTIDWENAKPGFHFLDGAPFNFDAMAYHMACKFFRTDLAMSDEEMTRIFLTHNTYYYETVAEEVLLSAETELDIYNLMNIPKRHTLSCAIIFMEREDSYERQHLSYETCRTVGTANPYLKYEKFDAIEFGKWLVENKFGDPNTYDPLLPLSVCIQRHYNTFGRR